MADTRRFLMRGLLHAYYWCDEGLQNSLRAAGMPSLSRTKSMIMVNIADGITRPSDLARNIGISRQAIQQTIVEMERAGLVRLAPDPSDGRAKIVKFSRRGSGIGETAFNAMDAIETELAGRLGKQAVAQLNKVLFSDWGAVVGPESNETGAQNSTNSKSKGKT
jgi:DNA-binding MarR family transcriptional regulator